LVLASFRLSIFIANSKKTGNRPGAGQYLKNGYDAWMRPEGRQNGVETDGQRPQRAVRAIIHEAWFALYPA